MAIFPLNKQTTGWHSVIALSRIWSGLKIYSVTIIVVGFQLMTLFEEPVALGSNKTTPDSLIIIIILIVYLIPWKKPTQWLKIEVGVWSKYK